MALRKLNRFHATIGKHCQKESMEDNIGIINIIIKFLVDLGDYNFCRSSFQQSINKNDRKLNYIKCIYSRGRTLYQISYSNVNDFWQQCTRDWLSKRSGDPLHEILKQSL